MSPARLYVGIAASLALAWVGALLLDEPRLILSLVSAAAAAGVIAFELIRRLRERRGVSGLEDSLTRQADAEVAFTSPDQADEIGSMTRQFTEAVHKLRSSKLGKQGYDALYAMPWYMIIGPPGSGKTTALSNSGLEFPLRGPKSGLRGFGGTRNCEWWLTNEAVLLDTAGRYTSQDEDHDEWLAFLDLLLRFRSRRPIEGVIAAISADELAGAAEEQVIERARQIRSRINEVMGRLNMIVPVYVMVTKCDLLPGFSDLFGSLTRSERRQIWGITLRSDQRLPPGAALIERFEEMVRAAEEHAYRGLLERRRIDVRSRVFNFPEQLRALGPNLGLFVNTLFVDNVYQERPLLRGVYLTSGTQEGRLIDRVMSSMATKFGLGRVASIEHPVDTKSYFLGDVFTRVIFPDSGLAVRSERQQRRERALRIASALGLGLAAVAVATVSWVTYAEARGDVDVAADGVELAASEAELERAIRECDEVSPLGRAVHMRCRAEQGGE